MAKQIQILNKNTNCQHKYNMTKQIKQVDDFITGQLNANWQNKYEFGVTEFGEEDKFR